MSIEQTLASVGAADFHRLGDTLSFSFPAGEGRLYASFKLSQVTVTEILQAIRARQ